MFTPPQGGQPATSITPIYPTPLPRHRALVVTAAPKLLPHPDMTCGAARSILPGRASRGRNREVRSSRNNVASSCTEGGHGREAKAAMGSIQGVGNQDGVVWS